MCVDSKVEAAFVHTRLSRWRLWESMNILAEKLVDENLRKNICTENSPKINGRKKPGEKILESNIRKETPAAICSKQLQRNPGKKNTKIFGDKLPEKWLRRSHSQRTSGQKKKGKKNICKETSGTKSSMNILAEKLVDEKSSKKHLHRNVWRNVWTNNPGRKQWQKTSGAEKLRRNRKSKA